MPWEENLFSAKHEVIVFVFLMLLYDVFMHSILPIVDSGQSGEAIRSTEVLCCRVCQQLK